MYTEGIKIFLSLLKPQLMLTEEEEYYISEKRPKLTQFEILEEIITAVNQYKI